MTPVTNIREQLRRDEGERLAAYRDTEHLLTIGIGRCIDRVPFTPEEAAICGCSGSDDYAELRITPEASAFLFENDIQKFDRELRRTFPWVAHLDDARFGVLLNLAFNLGMNGLRGFTQFLAAMERGNWHDAAIHMMDSKWSHQVGARALRLRDQVRTGQWV